MYGDGSDGNGDQDGIFGTSSRGGGEHGSSTTSSSPPSSKEITIMDKYRNYDISLLRLLRVSYVSTLPNSTHNFPPLTSTQLIRS
jgi:hypothetical protein